MFISAWPSLHGLVQWLWPSLEKKRRVLCSSWAWYQDCWHTGLLYGSLILSDHHRLRAAWRLPFDGPRGLCINLFFLSPIYVCCIWCCETGKPQVWVCAFGLAVRWMMLLRLVYFELKLYWFIKMPNSSFLSKVVLLTLSVAGMIPSQSRCCLHYNRCRPFQPCCHQSMAMLATQLVMLHRNNLCQPNQ